MLDTSSDKRKYFRFPAYDDEVGVKLASKRERILFEDDWSIMGQESSWQPSSRPTTKSRKQRFDQVDEFEEFHANKKMTEELEGNLSGKSHLELNSLTRSPRSNRIRRDQSTKISKDNHSNYKNLFGKQLQYAEQARQKEEEFSKKIKAKISHDSPLDNYQPKSHFVPKYIPASRIEEPEISESAITKQDLLQHMQKTQDSYLLFANSAEEDHHSLENEEVAAIHNEIEHQEIPVTRRQFQRIKTDVPDTSSGEYHEIGSLPRSRMGLKNAKIQVKNESAYGMKQEEKREAESVLLKKKNNRLEKSLSGIIKDETKNFQNKYFD